MATKLIKDDVIRVRVTKEHKEKLKKIAEEKKVTISEIISVATKNEIKSYEEKEKNYKKICERAVATEKKIQEIKINLENRRKKRSLLDKLLYFKK
ncbi:CopG family transcriptional regulator [Clostridium perfringens]|uniref:CopG family transcriptional regulator n=1 Tax=Clostridium perfringens TaxID=1502 RepID=UPI000B389624|nr:CopG family transcriptional regulator [Clostridium perfringens]OUN49406.1 CopG family transcriptional regulator [Clostridium perfringens]OUP41471.1 CopG family transcriptional regulator [Clostridium perfringens]